MGEVRKFMEMLRWVADKSLNATEKVLKAYRSLKDDDLEKAYWALKEARDALDEAIDRLSGMLRREA